MEPSQFLYVKVLFAKISANAPGKVIAGVAMSITEFFFDGALVETAIAALIALIIMDFITAIIACYKTGEQIKSAKVFRTALKLGIYGILVSAGHLTEKTIGVDMIPLNAIDETMLAFLGLTELISIMENSGRMGFQMPSLLLNKLKQAQGAK